VPLPLSPEWRRKSQTPPLSSHFAWSCMAAPRVFPFCYCPTTKLVPPRTRLYPDASQKIRQITGAFSRFVKKICIPSRDHAASCANTFVGVTTTLRLDLSSYKNAALPNPVFASVGIPAFGCETDAVTSSKSGFTGFARIVSELTTSNPSPYTSRIAIDVGGLSVLKKYSFVLSDASTVCTSSQPCSVSTPPVLTFVFNCA